VDCLSLEIFRHDATIPDAPPAWSTIVARKPIPQRALRSAHSRWCPYDHRHTGSSRSAAARPLGLVVMPELEKHYGDE
jgi:hypothetical protein